MDAAASAGRQNRTIRVDDVRSTQHHFPTFLFMPDLEDDDSVVGHQHHFRLSSRRLDGCDGSANPGISSINTNINSNAAVATSLRLKRKRGTTHHFDPDECAKLKSFTSINRTTRDRRSSRSSILSGYETPATTSVLHSQVEEQQERNDQRLIDKSGKVQAPRTPHLASASSQKTLMCLGRARAA